MLKPPFGRQGNKMNMLTTLLRFIPEHDLYVELFLGSGALFFNKEPTKSILNDNDEDVIYRLKLVKKVPLFQPTNHKYTVDELKELFDKPQRTLKDKLIHEKIKASTGFSNIPIKNASQILKPNNPYSIANHLQEYKSLLKHATLTQQDYKVILKKYDSPSTFFFIDPPYDNTHKRFYKNNTIHFEELRDLLRHLQGWFLLTINDSPYNRKIFKEFNIERIVVQTPHQGQPPRDELIIRNYS